MNHLDSALVAVLIWSLIFVLWPPRKRRILGLDVIEAGGTAFIVGDAAATNLGSVTHLLQSPGGRVSAWTSESSYMILRYGADEPLDDDLADDGPDDEAPLT